MAQQYLRIHVLLAEGVQPDTFTDGMNDILGAPDMGVLDWAYSEAREFDEREQGLTEAYEEGDFLRTRVVL